MRRTETEKPGQDTGIAERAGEKKPYVKPRILSAEMLENIAAACDPPTGKTPDFFCDQSQS